jgi:multicomponent Na+:H+ antiporter subunit C
MVSTHFLAGLPYALIMLLALTGAALSASAGNLLKRIVGLAIFWTALALFVVATGVLAGGEAPILPPGQGAFGKSFSNPLQQDFARMVLIGGAASVILALAIVVRIREAYGSIEGDVIATDDDVRDDEEGKA